jgi:DNA-binding MarR family transcriptional regulator
MRETLKDSKRLDAAASAVTTLIRAADGAARSLEEFFREHGLTGQQYNVLRILRGARSPLPTMDVAERLIQKTPALTGILDRLEKKGLVQRERSEADRRVWLCSLTEAGLRTLDDIDPQLAAANRKALDRVRDDLDVLSAALQRLGESR